MFEEYDNIVTAEEASEMLRVGMNRIYVLLNSKELAGYREGKVWRISKIAIKKYIENKSLGKAHPDE